jgi:sec-independent protein translocase protein TatA
MLPNLGAGELVILLVIILVFFGAKRIPELARSLGTGMREFKRGTSGEAAQNGKSRADRAEEEENLRAEREP